MLWAMWADDRDRAGEASRSIEGRHWQAANLRIWHTKLEEIGQMKTV
jgi:hypothetical protein